MRIGMREFARNMAHYFDLVRQGEPVEITSRNDLIAVLNPPDPERAKHESLVRAGLIEPAESDEDILDLYPVPPPYEGEEPPSVVLARMREGER